MNPSHSSTLGRPIFMTVGWKIDYYNNVIEKFSCMENFLVDLGTMSVENINIRSVGSQNETTKIAACRGWIEIQVSSIHHWTPGFAILLPRQNPRSKSALLTLSSGVETRLDGTAREGFSSHIAPSRMEYRF
jgi:hypothetical protein